MTREESNTIRQELLDYARVNLYLGLIPLIQECETALELFMVARDMLDPFADAAMFDALYERLRTDERVRRAAMDARYITIEASPSGLLEAPAAC